MPFFICSFHIIWKKHVFPYNQYQTIKCSPQFSDFLNILNVFLSLSPSSWEEQEAKHILNMDYLIHHHQGVQNTERRKDHMDPMEPVPRMMKAGVRSARALLDPRPLHCCCPEFHNIHQIKSWGQGQAPILCVAISLPPSPSAGARIFFMLLLP